MKLSEKLDEFVERQGIVSAEFCKLVDQVETFEEANAQLAEKIKLLDALKENAELKLKETLRAYRPMKEALEFYAVDLNRDSANSRIGYLKGDHKDFELHSDGMYYGGKLARNTLKELDER
jgi:hypothetical protein